MRYQNACTECAGRLCSRRPMDLCPVDMYRECTLMEIVMGYDID